MAKCPACGVNLNDWHILTLGKKSNIVCSHCGKALKPRTKVSGVKVLLGTGFLLGGIAGGLIVAFGVFVQWIVFVMIWFLLLALADVRYTQLEVDQPQHTRPEGGG